MGWYEPGENHSTIEKKNVKACMHTYTHNFVRHRMFLVGYTNELVTGVRGSMYFLLYALFTLLDILPYACITAITIIAILKLNNKLK